MTEPKSRVQSVDRAALALEFLGAGDAAGASLSAIAAELGVARSTAHALLRTLEAHGLVAEVPGPRFVLGTGLIKLGDIASKQVPIAEVARPVLSTLARESGLTTRLAIAEHGYPVFVARVDGPGIVRFDTPLGGREAPHSSAAGKVILADLPEDQVRSIVEVEGLPRRTAHTITELDTLLSELEKVRANGYAVDDEEDLAGIFCVAAGVRSGDGRIIGAISTTGIATDPRSHPVAELGETIRKYAADLESRVGR
ncbi:IclR family transcriptional regulator [Nocardioidaceae bacterium SCSIO 66511]|nr:IclR family transcriptional regulator [Nocardioidaceae bacterium SCSIO 66511]